MNPSQNKAHREPIKDRSDPDAVRQAFRVPVETADDISAVLNETSFPVVDMNPEGISLLCKDDSEFADTRIIENCSLKLPAADITGLAARIIHRTHISDETWHIGLQWIDLSDEHSDKIVAAVAAIKEKLRKMAAD